jgi:hypothetical protein
MLRKLVLVYGIAFLAVGLLGLATHGLAHHSSNLLGIFPVNGLHNLLHLLIGVAGLVCYAMSVGASRAYLRVVGAAYTLLGSLGIFAPHGFGHIPIGGADIALHLAAGILALYVGFSSRWTVATPRYGGA